MSRPLDDATVSQLRNAVATLTSDLVEIRAGRAIALSHEIANHVDAARELLERVDAERSGAVLRIGGAA